MPDWNALVPEGWTALQLVGWIVAGGLLIALIVKLWPFVRNAVAIVDALVRLPALAVQVDQIHHETHKNDGSSIKDAVERVEAGVAGLHDRMDDVDQQLQSLASEDVALWEAVEQTQNPDED